jgi:hypothetical protein
LLPSEGVTGQSQTAAVRAGERGEVHVEACGPGPTEGQQREGGVVDLLVGVAKNRDGRGGLDLLAAGVGRQ